MTDPITAAARVLAETSRCAWSIASPEHPYGKDCLDDHPDKHPGVGYCWVRPQKQAQMLAEAGLLAAPDLRQVGPRVGASLGPVLEAILEAATDGAAYDFDSAESALQTAQRRGAALDQIRYLVIQAQDRVAVHDAHSAAPRAPADPPAGVESGQGRSGAVRGVVEDRMRALAADMDRDTPLTAEILRQFADEVTHLRAAGDRAIQSIVSRLPEADDPTTPEGQ